MTSSIFCSAFQHLHKAWVVLLQWAQSIPYSVYAMLGRFSIAATFWASGQTKVEGFAINLLDGTFELGWPRLSDSAIALFQYEYALPLISPVWAAHMAAFAEHALPVLILMGLGTRFAAAGLLLMTLVIQFFVYPGAYATHGLWATVLLMLIARGAGCVSLDYLFVKKVEVLSCTKI